MNQYENPAPRPDPALPACPGGRRGVTHVSVPGDDDIAWHKALADDIEM